MPRGAKLRRVIKIVIFIVTLCVIPGLFVGNLRAAETGRVAQIKIEGTERIEPATVLSYMKIHVGDPFDPKLIDESLKSLFATGLFSNVNLKQEGDVLVVKVTENPIINRIAFEGNHHLNDKNLLSEINLRPRLVYTPSRVEAAVRRIIQLYRRSGRFAATVDPMLIHLSENRVNIVFEIHEGSLTTVSHIRFIGNRSFPASKLRGQLATKEWRWYRILSTDDTYDPDRLSVDRERLRRFYLDHGFADFRVLSAVAELAPDEKSFNIVFALHEGDRYKFGKIDLTSRIPNVDIGALKKEIITKTGDTYDAELVEKSIEKITNALGTQGYAFVDVEPEAHRDAKTRTMGITYVVNRGPRVYVQRINITGNVMTLDRVIRREFLLVEGDAFNTAKLRESIRRIRRLDFFSKVNVSQHEGTHPDQTVIDVNVQEKSTGSLTFGAGYSTTDLVIGTVGIQEANLLGTGDRLSANLALSIRRSFADIGFTNPWFLGREMAASVNVYHESTNYQFQSNYNEGATGFSLGLSYPLTEHVSQGFNYSLTQNVISSVPSTASPFIQAEVGSTVTSALGYTLSYDTRNDRMAPTKGIDAKITESVAGLGGSIRYLETTASYKQYFPIVSPYVIEAGIQGGYIHGIGQPVRLANRFFLGGTNFGESFIGFADGGVGPRDTSTGDSLGGNEYYTGTVVLSFPIGLPREFGILGQVFTQAGSLFGIDQSGPHLFDSRATRVAAGFGLSWQSPFGPMKIDFGFPILKQSADKTQVFQFSFGTAF